METKSLKDLFEEGIATIPVTRASNLFSQLGKRKLTIEEESIVAQRVALQRNLLAVFELREQQRKAAAVAEVFPNLLEADINKLLELHSCEEEAIAALLADPELLNHYSATNNLEQPPVQESNSCDGTNEEQCSKREGVQNDVYIRAFKGKGVDGRRAPRQQLRNNCGPLLPELPTGYKTRPRTALPRTKNTLPLHNLGHGNTATCSWDRGRTAACRVDTSDSDKSAASSDAAHAATTHCELEGSISLPAQGPDESVQPLAPYSQPHGGCLNGVAEHVRCPEGALDSQAVLDSRRGDLDCSVLSANEPRCHGGQPSFLSAAESRGAAVGCDEGLLRTAEDGPYGARSSPGSEQSAQLGVVEVREANSEDQALELQEGPHPQLQDASMGSRSGRPKRKAAEGVAQLVQALQLPLVGGFSRELITRKRKKRDQLTVSLPRQLAVDEQAAVQPAQELLDPDSNEMHSSGAPMRKPRLGRVKRCSTKAVELLELGRLKESPGWQNKGYMFPDGYTSRTLFRSSEDLSQTCWHTCSIVGRQGKYWPAPTFQIVATDNPKPVVAKSATGAWSGILARINAAIQARRRAGEDLPPPPGTAIPGPEFYGLTNPSITSKIEQLDTQHRCALYWQGKQERLAYVRVHGNKPEKKDCFRRIGGPAQAARTSYRAVSVETSEDEDDIIYADDSGNDSDEEDAARATLNRWSSVDRAQRLRRRKGEDCGEEQASPDDEDMPLQDMLDPITLQPLRRPAMSPSGHVMGLATWTAVLAEYGRCPFTKRSLHREQLVLLTKANIERYRSRLIIQ